MKKITFTLLMIVCLLALVGCGHEHQYTEKKVDATCTEKGYTEYTCECGESYKDNEVDALGHSYSDWKVVKEATETEKGSKEKVCSVCNDKVTEEIPVKEHVHKYTEKKVEPTCTEKGYTEYTCECGDKYTDNEVDPAHKEEVIPGKAATCKEEGLTDGKKCSVCGEVLEEQKPIEISDHTFGEWVTVKEASYVANGLKEKACTVCEEKVTEEIPMLVDPNEGKTFDKITIKDKTYDKLSDALTAAVDGDVIYLPAGTYKDDIKIEKSIALKGNNMGVNPNTDKRKAESIFTGTITCGACDLLIDGIALTGKGQINSNASADQHNVVFKNIYAYDIDSDSTWTDSEKNYRQIYIINVIGSTDGRV